MARKTTPRPTVRLRLEAVEDRTVPANFSPTTVNELIAAINTANTNNESDTIILIDAAPYTFLTLNNTTNGGNALPTILPDNGNSLTISGNGADLRRATLAGTPSFRFFNLADGANLTLSRVDMVNGSIGFNNNGIGGGAVFGSRATFTADGCAFVGNSAFGDGGALSFSRSTVTVRNSTFDGNSTSSAGGAIGFTEGPASLALTNCTITNNTASTSGGGIVSGGFVPPSINITNTVISGNRANGVASSVVTNGATLNAVNSIFSPAPQVAPNGTNTGNQFDVDPNLGALQDNGGNTPTRLPNAGSPAIDAGSTGNASGAIDQRGTGFARIVGTVDIGAVEVQAGTTATATGTTNTTTPNGTTLTTAVTAVSVTGPNGTTTTTTVTTTSSTGLVTIQVPPGAQPIVAGAAPGTPPLVNVFDPRTGLPVRTIIAYDADFTGGVNAVAGDVTGDGVPDIVTAPASDGGADIRVFDGKSGTLLISFLAYGASFDGGANVAVGDVNGDGRPDIVTGAGAGGGSHVRAFSGGTYVAIRDFLAYGPGYTGGVTVAAADVDGDKVADIVTGTQSGGNHLRVFGLAPGVQIAGGLIGPAGDTGLSVAAADVTGDGLAEVVVGPRTGGTGVAVLDARTLQPLALTNAFPGLATGVTLSAVDPDGNGQSDVVAAVGAVIRVLDGRTLAPTLDVLPFGG